MYKSKITEMNEFIKFDIIQNGINSLINVRCHLFCLDTIKC